MVGFDQFGGQGMVAVFEVGEGVSGRVSFDGGGFCKFRLVQPEVDMALPGNGEIGSEELGGKFVAGEDLAFDGGKNNQAWLSCVDCKGKQKKDDGDYPTAHVFIVEVKLGVVKKK